MHTSTEDKPKDNDGGDAGALLKKARYFPSVYFIRSQYCCKSTASNQPDS